MHIVNFSSLLKLEYVLLCTRMCMHTLRVHLSLLDSCLAMCYLLSADTWHFVCVHQLVNVRVDFCELFNLTTITNYYMLLCPSPDQN